MIKKSLSFLRLFPNDNHDQYVNTPFAYLAKGLKISYLEPLPLNQGVSLPSELVIQPGQYKFHHHQYDIQCDGLYRFIFPEKYNEQRIVYTDDLPQLMSSIAWMLTHGEQDDSLSYNELKLKAKNNKLILTCEAATRFALKFLTSVKIKSRVIGTRALNQLNTYDAGHYLIEVFNQNLNKWVLYDIDQDVYFTYLGKPLSLLEMIDHLNGDYEINYISQDIRADVTSHSGNYPFVFINEARLAHLKHWYKRIMQLTYIEDHNENISCYEFGVQSNEFPRGFLPSVRYIERDRFIFQYYQQGAL
ncbi:MAG: hypothetical protein H0W64_10630 [Gammaproteobacteria bacterium]|nr:hypothetical protein [Gammaproteobacteria bacterium]